MPVNIDPIYYKIFSFKIVNFTNLVRKVVVLEKCVSVSRDT